MKRLILSVFVFGVTISICNAQSSQQKTATNNSGEPLWKPNAKICEPHKAEQKAQNSMVPAVKALNNAAQDKTDKNINAAKTIYCNPPTKTTGARKAN